MAESKELLLETCLLAGKIMMENGSEVYRVEDTMNRIAANAGEQGSISYVTATGLFMGLRSNHYAQVENVHDRVINLEKIVAVNGLSRAYAEKNLVSGTARGIKKGQSNDTKFSLLAAGV